MASPAEVLPAAPDVREAPAGIPREPRRGARYEDGAWRQQEWVSRGLYWGVHVACGAALLTGVSLGDVLLLLATFWLRMFGITAGYHRYFSHRAFKTGRGFQFVLALLGTTAVQKGPLWWAGGHRRHHRYSDQPGDMHSPREGFWYAHQGWIFDGRWDDTEVENIRDFAKFPELVWLNRWHPLPPVALALVCLAIGGWSGLVWGFFVSTVLLWHTTYMVNSLCHVWGKRRYETSDDSRNNWLVALLTLGEGWHNNHHYYQACARQGFFWWEIDITYYALRALQALGVVRDLREPPDRVLAAARPRPRPAPVP